MNSRLYFYLAAFIATVAVLGLGYASDRVNADWQYQPDWAVSGEYWRLISGHIAHLNLTHAALNMAALWLIVFNLGEQYRTREWLFAGLVISVGISLGLWLWRPDLSDYVGLSGTLHGLLLYGLAPLCQAKSKLAWLALAAVGGKLALEQLAPNTNISTQELIGGNVITDAHLLGAMIGALFYAARTGLITLTNTRSKA
ncbi:MULTISPECIES: rhombosortase [unclassified Gilvimarinus]|uniref:rhombosortase n=1 Tax=unclassified Gilvimarinus TaxID=2642066 RepID=UPI0026E2AA3D|nr:MULTISPECIES: rhombosortase [unclassified Gilvimarinus]MDO6569828.1 rhombosortase [Gilvimarinus sp. 2_MG-2023]MDO6747050.1 rhombosortase [Gilvimarinus sp. 1_MG-2023]